MLTDISSYLKRIPEVVGVEILVGEGDSWIANLAVLRRERTKVHFVNGEYKLASMDALKERVPGGAPLVLTISGKGIIHRFIVAEPLATEDDYLRKVLPNAKPGEFYVQISPVDGQQVVSVARRALVDELAKQVLQAGMELLSVSLGPFALLLFKGYLPAPNAGSLAVGPHQFTVDQGVFRAYQCHPSDTEAPVKRLRIAGEELNEYLMPAFALAFYAISDLDAPHVPFEGEGLRTADFRERLLFRRLAVGLIGFFLLLLLGNALLFMSYSGKVAGYTGSDAPGIQQEIEKLQQQVRAREQLLGGLWQADSRQWGMAYMADRIGESLPDGMLLTELVIYPKDEGLSRKERRPVHRPSSIGIKGTCADIALLNQWIGTLRALPFCQVVDLSEYGFDERERMGIFTLNLTLDP